MEIYVKAVLNSRLSETLPNRRREKFVWERSPNKTLFLFISFFLTITIRRYITKQCLKDNGAVIVVHTDVLLKIIIKFNCYLFSLKKSCSSWVEFLREIGFYGWSGNFFFLLFWLYVCLLILCDVIFFYFFFFGYNHVDTILIPLYSLIKHTPLFERLLNTVKC